MNYTIFDTPILKTLVRWLVLGILKITGWRAEGELPETRKFVLIAAPHTSNWDLPIMLYLAFVFKVKIYWMGKDTIFRQPFAGFFKWLGGIPIDRSKANNVVDQSIEQLQRHEELILTVPPTGTRKKVTKWKTGFYHIAHGANVPIVLGFIDYRRKVGGLGPVVHPTGDIEKDMKTIMAFYAGITGKYPEKSAISSDFQSD
ncbi:MAG: glycerol acyltransferase [Proteobacteria bacterium]|nr:glycerol acyltransferase [Pseudomonadota bacterium]